MSNKTRKQKFQFDQYCNLLKMLTVLKFHAFKNWNMSKCKKIEKPF